MSVVMVAFAICNLPLLEALTLDDDRAKAAAIAVSIVGALYVCGWRHLLL
jgi:hypothetical protein